MSDSVAIISTIAAVVSAIGGAVAAVAAFRSAGSAQSAQDAAQTSEKRAALRQLSVTASEVLVEAGRASSRGAELKSAYQTLSTFANASGGSRLGMRLDEVDKKLIEVENMSQRAKPFASGQDSLMNGPVDEINSREITMSQVLTMVRARREDLEREHASVEAQNKIYREQAIQSVRR